MTRTDTDFAEAALDGSVPSEFIKRRAKAAEVISDLAQKTDASNPKDWSVGIFCNEETRADQDGQICAVGMTSSYDAPDVIQALLETVLVNVQQCNRPAQVLQIAAMGMGFAYALKDKSEEMLDRMQAEAEAEQETKQ